MHSANKDCIKMIFVKSSLRLRVFPFFLFPFFVFEQRRAQEKQEESANAVSLIFFFALRAYNSRFALATLRRKLRQ